MNFDAIIIYSFRFENDFSASGKPTLTWCVEIRNIVPYLQLFFFFVQNYIFLPCFFVKMQNNTEKNYYFFPLHQTHNYTYILWAYDKQCFYCIVNEILLFCFLHKHKACIYYIKKVIYFIEIVYMYKHWSGVLYRLYRFYFLTKSF